MNIISEKSQKFQNSFEPLTNQLTRTSALFTKGELIYGIADSVAELKSFRNISLFAF